MGKIIRLRIREIATEKGLSMTKLSQRTEIDMRVIRKIYNSPTSTVTTDTLNRIANVLEVDASELLESVPDDYIEPAPERRGKRKRETSTEEKSDEP